MISASSTGEPNRCQLLLAPSSKTELGLTYSEGSGSSGAGSSVGVAGASGAGSSVGGAGASGAGSSVGGAGASGVGFSVGGAGASGVGFSVGGAGASGVGFSAGGSGAGGGLSLSTMDSFTSVCLLSMTPFSWINTLPGKSLARA